MLKVLSIALAVAFVTSAAAAPRLETAGKCRDAGKFVAAEKCKAAKPAVKHVCKDAQGKFAKCGSPGAKPVK